MPYSSVHLLGVRSGMGGPVPFELHLGWDLLSRLGPEPRHTGEPMRRGRDGRALNVGASPVSGPGFCGLRSSLLHKNISITSQSKSKSGKSHPPALEVTQVSIWPLLNGTQLTRITLLGATFTYRTRSFSLDLFPRLWNTCGLAAEGQNTVNIWCGVTWSVMPASVFQGNMAL